MSVSKDNSRLIITISKAKKEQLEQLAKRDGRAVSNLCAKIISDYLLALKGGESS